jgi:hypothetical protein
MFDIGKILSRAWQTLWKYRVLWIFGLLLALSGAGGGSGGSSGGGNSSYQNDYNNQFGQFENFNGFQYDQNTPAWAKEMGTWAEAHVVPLFATPEKALQTGIWIIVILLGFSIVMGLLMALIRYPSETAVIRMVDDHEQTGNKVKFKEGWKLGWNRRAFRMWLVDLLISIPAIIYVAMLVGVGLLFAFNADKMNAGVSAGLTVGIGLFLLFTLAFVVFMIALGMLRELVVRFVAIEDMTVTDAFANGWIMFKRNFKNLFLTWLVLVGIGIGIGFALVIAFFLLTPAYALMTIPGAIVAAIPGAIGYGITSIFAASTWAPWVIGALVAIPFFFTIVFLPLAFVEGWAVIFNLNVYTLMFRQFKFIASVPPVPVVPPAVEKK